jgi:hypothetical protein
MKRFICAAVVIMTIGSIPAFAANVGVSISIGQPGFYGRIDIGNAPQPEYVNLQPVIIQPVPQGRTVQPIYLRVPPGHQKNWKKYCGRYNACGQPVYFVKDKWYTDTYVPHYKKTHGNKEKDDRGKGHDRGEQKGHGRN